MPEHQFTLIIGNRNYSSWSMRAWLLMRLTGAPFEEVLIHLYQPDSRQKVKTLGGETGLVPVLKDGDLVIWDTLAIAEYLYESFPQIWPKSKKLRALGRSLAAEVHSSLNALRGAMPMNTRARHRSAIRSVEVNADIERVMTIWTDCLHQHSGPWLLGDFSAADIMFAPVATRFQTYDVNVIGSAADYWQRLLHHPLVVEWMVLGAAEPEKLEKFELPSN